MERRKFTREFKLEAVRLIKDRGVSYVEASEDLGVHTSRCCTSRARRLGLESGRDAIRRRVTRKRLAN
jgi:transposase-like protein